MLVDPTAELPTDLCLQQRGMRGNKVSFLIEIRHISLVESSSAQSVKKTARV